MKSFFKIYFRRIKKRKSKPKAPSKKYIQNKESARKLVLSRLEFYNEHYKYKIGRVAIRNQKSRWGSCSSRGNLNFNYKIVFLPAHLSDYIVVHELSHLGQLNHSQKFWDLVEQTIPEYEKCISELRKVKV